MPALAPSPRPLPPSFHDTLAPRAPAPSVPALTRPTTTATPTDAGARASRPRLVTAVTVLAAPPPVVTIRRRWVGGRFGLTLQHRHEADTPTFVVVSAISKTGTAARQADLRVGDVVAMINGETAAAMSPLKLRTVLRTATTLTLQLGPPPRRRPKLDSLPSEVWERIFDANNGLMPRDLARLGSVSRRLRDAARAVEATGAAARNALAQGHVDVLGVVSCSTTSAWLPRVTDASGAAAAWPHLPVALVVTVPYRTPRAPNAVAFACARDASVSLAMTAAVAAASRGLPVALPDTDLADLVTLKGAPEVDLTGCERVTDVAPLAGAAVVRLAHCTALANASPLAAAPVVDLRGCLVLRDVGALGRVRSLCLADCPLVSDVGALGGVDTLDLTRCVGVTDVSALGGVRELTLAGCVGVVDVSALGGVDALDLSGCVSVVDVSALATVKTLTLRGCSGITDVSALRSVRRLDLSHCRGVTDVSALDGVVSVNLAGTGATLPSMAALRGVSALTATASPPMFRARTRRAVRARPDPGAEEVGELNAGDVVVATATHDDWVMVSTKGEAPRWTRFRRTIPHFGATLRLLERIR